MITFGLTGGIACGKSTVTKTFTKYNIPMVDADVVARDVVRPATPGLDKIISAFGKEYLMGAQLDRPKLGQLVFNNKEAMSKLNTIMAPLIEEEAGNQIKSFHDKGHPIVGYDAALICEMGNYKKYRPLIVVSCPVDTQVERLMKRNSLTREYAMTIISTQMPLDKKLALADYVIDTSGSIEDSIKQTKAVINKLAGSVVMG